MTARALRPFSPTPLPRYGTPGKVLHSTNYPNLVPGKAYFITSLRLYLPVAAQSCVYGGRNQSCGYTDIAIIGGGLAGSTAAAMLGRAGISTVLDRPARRSIRPTSASKNSAATCSSSDSPRPDSPEIGAAHAISFAGENWIARFGRLLDKAPSPAIRHPLSMSSSTRSARKSPKRSARIHSKAVSIATSPERQRVALSNDETISARLVVLANGLNVGLRHQLGIRARHHQHRHSISIGFDVVPVGRAVVRLSRR